MVNELNAAREYVKNTMDDAMKVLTSFQSTPPGTVKRSKRQQTTMLERINKLPPDIRLQVVDRIMQEQGGR